MAHKPFARCFIVWLNVILGHPVFDAPDQFCIQRMLDITAFRINDAVGAAGIKSGHNIAVLISSHRKLGLISVKIRVLHADDRRHLIVADFAHTHQKILNFILLILQLLFIVHMLKLAAAACSRFRAFRLHPVR